MEDSPKIILNYESNEFEIPLPKDYKELLNIFVDKFKIDENCKKSLLLTYFDGEDDVWLEQDEGYEQFKEQVKENNKIRGIVSRESRVSIDNKDFLLQFEKIQKTFAIPQEQEENVLDKKISIEKSHEDYYINVDLDKDDIVKTINPVEKYLYSDADNEKNKEENGEIKNLKEEKEKQDKKLTEYEQKLNDLKENYKTKLEMEKNYIDKISKLEIDLKRLTEDKNEKELKLEYESKAREQEKEYINELEQQKLKYESQMDKINSEIKSLKVEKDEKEAKLNEYIKKFEKQEKDYQTKLKSEENKYNLKVDEYNKKIEEINHEKGIISLKLEDYEKRIEEYNKNDDKKNKDLYEEKIKNLEQKEKDLNSYKNELLKKNRELSKILQEKENIIKENEQKLKNNEEKSSIIISEYEEKNNKFEKEIQNYKTKLETLKEKEKDIKYLIEGKKQLLKENKKDKDEIYKFKERTKLIQKCFDDQSKEYKSELNKIKNEFKSQLNKKCEEEIKNKYNNIMYNNLYKEINNHSEIILKNYLEKLEKFENKRRNDFTKIINGNKVFLDINETIHDGIKCNNCSQKPIIGERYQCSKCENYNLCQKCEEENSITLKHKHYFIKIRNIFNDDEEKNNKKYEKKDFNNFEKKDNNITENKNIEIEKNIKYSFKIQDKKDIYELYRGTKFYDIKLKIINDSKFEYPDGAIIKFSDKSDIKPNLPEIKINKLIPNESQIIVIKFIDLKIFEAKENPYNSIFHFEINGEKIGDEIIILMKFLDEKNPKLAENFRDTVKRINSKILENKSNEEIIKQLKKNNCNFDYTLNKFLNEFYQ